MVLFVGLRPSFHSPFFPTRVRRHYFDQNEKNTKGQTCRCFDNENSLTKKKGEAPCCHFVPAVMVYFHDVSSMCISRSSNFRLMSDHRRTSNHSRNRTACILHSEPSQWSCSSPPPPSPQPPLAPRLMKQHVLGLPGWSTVTSLALEVTPQLATARLSARSRNGSTTAPASTAGVKCRTTCFSAAQRIKCAQLNL